MSVEIERKFLIANDNWKNQVRGIRYRQGYISIAPDRTVRVRTSGETAMLTIKGESNGVSRAEFEYEIPVEDANEILNTMCGAYIIEKIRYKIPYAGFVWEVDEFLGANSPLILAEIELEYEDQLFEIPDWIGDEVTGDPRYYNAYLVRNPYLTWQHSEGDYHENQ
ncbi:CYTH domain-containing protein [candidate division KSB1 bacterium]|nr:CYTH domain-containing protein [candidate division KSB1 bacterium]